MFKIEKNEKRRIGKSISIRKAGISTKLCPYCNGKIIPGMLELSFSATHFGDRLGKKSIYSNDNVYLHIGCFEAFVKEARAKIKKNMGDIKQVKLEVGAEQL